MSFVGETIPNEDKENTIDWGVLTTYNRASPDLRLLRIYWSVDRENNAYLINICGSEPEADYSNFAFFLKGAYYEVECTFDVVKEGEGYRRTAKIDRVYEKATNKQINVALEEFDLLRNLIIEAFKEYGTQIDRNFVVKQNVVIV